MLFESILIATGIYLLCGLAFGLLFVGVGAGRLDPAARGTSPVFRLLILPGSIALWPFLAIRWVQREIEGVHS